MGITNKRSGLDRFWRRHKEQAERWPVLQIEITSRCPMRCSFCPNKTLGRNWQPGDLPWEVYRDQVVPDLNRFELAYLQGWGEPLLHPHLWEMIALAQAAGCRVGFTTCGTLLTAENGNRLLDAGIALLAISFAGATPEVHESLRIGSDFRRLVANVERLAARRAAGQPPQLQLHFLMMRSNLSELPTFVRLAASLGADEVVATNLTYTPTPELDALRVFASEQPDPGHQALLAEAAQTAQQSRIKFRAYPLVMNPNVLECDAQPTQTAFVNCRGEVTPCVYLGMPVVTQSPRYFLGESHPIIPVSFGNVRQGLLATYQGKSRAEFNAAFRSRLAYGRSALTSAILGEAGNTVPPDPPSPCRYCYKLYGV